MLSSILCRIRTLWHFTFQGVGRVLGIFHRFDESRQCTEHGHTVSVKTFRVNQLEVFWIVAPCSVEVGRKRFRTTVLPPYSRLKSQKTTNSVTTAVETSNLAIYISSALSETKLKEIKSTMRTADFFLKHISVFRSPQLHWVFHTANVKEYSDIKSCCAHLQCWRTSLQWALKKQSDIQMNVVEVHCGSTLDPRSVHKFRYCQDGTRNLALLWIL
jgi:hypothetical protein